MSPGAIPVTYTADDGSGTGVDKVELWAQAPGDTSFSNVATDTTPDSPSFSYNPTAGDGTYFFYTVAVDKMGNRETPPSGADTRTQITTPSDAPPPPPPTVITQLSEPPPAAQSAPSLPIVAALALEPKQTIRTALKQGLRFRVYVYRTVRLNMSATLVKQSARQVGLQRRPVVASRGFSFVKPAVYRVTMQLNKRAATRLRRATSVRSIRLNLKSVLSGAAGKSSSTSSLLLRR
jgi:hypothetical protein